MNEQNAVLKINVVFTLEQMMDDLFRSHEEVIISYSWNQSALYVFRDGVELDTLEDLYSKYNAVKFYPYYEFNGYDEMMALYIKEGL